MCVCMHVYVCHAYVHTWMNTVQSFFTVSILITIPKMPNYARWGGGY